MIDGLNEVFVMNTNDDLEAEIFERLDLEQSKKHTIIKALRMMYDL